jgi:osmoprotectant transport system permease protein
MDLFADALAWLISPERLEGSGALTVRIGEHLAYTGISVLIAALMAVPLGYLIGHTGRGRELAVGISGAARALPSFGLILLLVLLFGVLQVSLAAVVAFVLLAIPSILAGAYTGIQAIDRDTIDAARAIGMTEWQILWKVEIPLGLPLLIGGLRNGALQVIATVTLAAYVNLGGLGYDILQGLPLRRYDQMLGAAIVVMVLALAVDALFGLLQRCAVPNGVTVSQQRKLRSSPTRRAAVVGMSTEPERG